ncbi:MAG: LysR family transcriptional regulator [Alphaproteobacteria bacterium]|nr:LysR family transcriptional regulator [Alphaproteobacteria bacterium]MBT8476099.1 LysR family transcriptional regulator [Alphaproteobacteria bacterium]
MDNWTEIKTAYQVARLGTVTSAADRLGVHRATVIRHIDVLEAELGARLFLRSKTGYTPTEVGQDLLRVAQATDEQFDQLAGRARDQSEDITGEIVITAHDGIAKLLVPALQSFQTQHPGAVVRFVASAELLKLEYGQAHVAIRSGLQPTEPDNVVQPYMKIRLGLYAHESYVAQYGLPASQDEFAAHKFVCWEAPESPFPFSSWLQKNVPASSKALVSASQRVTIHAIHAGMGIGFYPEVFRQSRTDLIEVKPPQPDWLVPLWLVTHRDLHWSTKVQTLLRHIKDYRLPA